jgi:hypothetical protein
MPQRRYESEDAKRDRLQRTLMDCYRRDPDYRTLVQSTLTNCYEGARPGDFTQAISKHVRETLRLEAKDGSGTPTWAVRAVQHDVVVHVARRYGQRPYLDEWGERWMDVMLVPGEPRFRYEAGQQFRIEISASLLSLFPPIPRFDEDGEYIGDEDCEDELEFLVDEGLNDEQFEEVKRRAYAFVDYAIGEIKSEILPSKFSGPPRKNADTFDRDKEIAAALVQFLFHGKKLSNSGTAGVESRDTVRAEFANHIGIRLPQV